MLAILEPNFFKSIFILVVLKSVLQKWRNKSDSIIFDRLKMERAKMHHEKNVLKKSFESLKKNRISNLKKYVLQDWSDQFNRVRVAAKGFVKWRRELAERRQEQQKTLMALWHWAFTLKNKAYNGWTQYVGERRKKHIKERSAILLRQQLLAERATGHWLAVADQFWLKNKIEVVDSDSITKRQFESARRCFAKWKLKVNQGIINQKPKVEPKQIYNKPFSMLQLSPDLKFKSSNRPMPRIPDFLVGEVDFNRVAYPRLANIGVKEIEESIQKLPKTFEFEPIPRSSRSDSCSPKLLRPEDLVLDQLSYNPDSNRSSSVDLPLISPKEIVNVQIDQDEMDLRLMELKHRLELLMTMKCEASNLKVQQKSGHATSETLKKLEKLEKDIERETETCRILAELCHIEN